MCSRFALAVATAAALSGLLTSPAAACEVCRHRHHYVIVRGRSPRGLSWRIATGGPRTDTLGRRVIDFEFGFGPSATGEGGSTELSLPVPQAFAFTGTRGAQIGSYSESDFSGITGRGIAELKVTMTDGSQLEIHPTKARTALRSRFPCLRRLAFFNVFYAAGLRPVRAEAFDLEGHLVARAASKNGLFFVLRKQRAG